MVHRERVLQIFYLTLHSARQQRHEENAGQCAHHAGHGRDRGAGYTGGHRPRVAAA